MIAVRVQLGMRSDDDFGAKVLKQCLNIADEIDPGRRAIDIARQFERIVLPNTAHIVLA